MTAAPLSGNRRCEQFFWPLNGMGRSRRNLIGGIVLGVLTLAAVAPIFSAHAASTLHKAPLSADDVSILFPAPRSKSDFNRLIAIGDLTGTDPANPALRAPVWSDSAFRNFIGNALSEAGKIPNAHERMQVPPEAKEIKNWRIVSLRIDPGAPGLSDAIKAQFGQLPKIRLVVQSVILKPDKTVQVLDMAAHLIFDFSNGSDPPAKSGCFPRARPDLDRFSTILGEFAGLRDRLAAGEFGNVRIRTASRSLGVHPGLADEKAGLAFRDALKEILERHLSDTRLDSMAIMTLPDQAPEPWMFLSMVRVPPGIVPELPTGGYAPVHGPTLDGTQFTQALAVRSQLEVEPKPFPNNLNPITCQSGAGTPALPVVGRKGVATSELFDKPRPDVAKVKQIVDLIADPTRSHFFNTDCISCHTESRRAIDLLKVKSLPGVDKAVLPKDNWNVRNFGWFPSFPAAHETATRRTAAETTAVLQFIKSNHLLK
jgi:hypothetical protein